MQKLVFTTAAIRFIVWLDGTPCIEETEIMELTRVSSFYSATLSVRQPYSAHVQEWANAIETLEVPDTQKARLLLRKFT